MLGFGEVRGVADREVFNLGKGAVIRGFWGRERLEGEEWQYNGSEGVDVLKMRRWNGV
ncbi:hypothetical protein [Paenibacillus thermotolerans]|uniref:hypothetical protein n=1 Tax=Paenibacillus thermotolerans TaxID=3027807 RepID=UPI0023677361|nr:MULTISPECIES: hypothetical protein [unclassified Paenibacillus]